MKTIGTFRRHARKAGFAVLRYMPRTRLAVRHAYWKREAAKYQRLATSTAVDEKLVFFEAFGGRSFACSPRAIYLCLMADERFSDFHFVWSFKGAARLEEMMENEPLLQNERTKLVQRGSAEYFNALASATAIIQNNRLPEYVDPKPEQIFVQCWHGTPLKRLGYDVEIETSNALNTTKELADRFGMDAAKWTYLLSPSAYTSKHLADAFGLPEERRASVILEEGYPRNDAICAGRAGVPGAEELKRRLQASFGVPEGKKVLLYAPTWRDDSYKAGVGYTFDYLIDFDLLQRELGDEWVVLFRPHYYIANEFDFSRYEGFVIDVSKAEDINELYIASDVLVTDYSSVMFDFANLRRPMALFVPDYDRYAGEIRGFYFDLAEIPGPHCKTTDGLVEFLAGLDGYWDEYGAAYDAYVARFCPKDDGHAAERVVARIWPQIAGPAADVADMA